MENRNTQAEQPVSSEIKLTVKELESLLAGSSRNTSAPVDNVQASQPQMQTSAPAQEGGYSVDIKMILNAVVKNWWIILIATLLGGFIMLFVARAQYTQMYTAKVMMMVNNYNYGLSDSVSVNKTYISSADMMASQELIETYNIILNTRNTLDLVADRYKSLTGEDITYQEISPMISSGSVSGTQIYYVSVTSPDGQKSIRLAKAVAQCLPDQLESIVVGSSVTIVEDASVASIVPANFTPKVLAGAAVGFLITFAYAVLVGCVMNDKLENSAFLNTAFPSVPVLAQIPDTSDGTSTSEYGYYSYGYGYGYGYGYNTSKTGSGSAGDSKDAK